MSRRKLIREYIAVLLHEMLHAFLELWGCGTCRERFENIGIGGHGPAWQEAACALEIAAQDERFLDFGLVGMSREVGWATELQIGGRKLDREAVVLARKWEMEMKLLEHCFRKLKLTPGKAPRTQ